MAASSSPARREGAKTVRAAAAKSARAPRAKAPAAKPRRPSPAEAARQARRSALAGQFQAEIEQYARAFDESRDRALDRLIAEHDELDRIIADILALAAETAAEAHAANLSGAA